MREAENLGFRWRLDFDSHSCAGAVRHLLADTRVDVGIGRRPMVTTRYPRLVGHRLAVRHAQRHVRQPTICGIGRGDSSRRVIGQQSASLATLAEAMRVIKDRPRAGKRRCTGPWCRSRGYADGKLEIWMAATGRRRLRWPASRPTGSSCRRPTPTSPGGPSARCATRPGRRDAPPIAVTSAWPRPPMSAPTWPISGISSAGSAGWWQPRGGSGAPVRIDGPVPTALPTTSPGGRATTTLIMGGPGTRTPSFVADDIVDRFCLTGPPSAHVDRLRELAGLGVDQFAVYLMPRPARSHHGRLRRRHHPGA